MDNLGQKENHQEPSESKGHQDKHRPPRYRETGFDALLLGKVKPRFPTWVRLLPYVLSAVFFLSSFFTVFAPLPLLVFSLRVSTGRLVLALLANLSFVGLVGGWASAAVFFCSVGVISLALPYFFLKKKYPVERAVVMTLLSMAFTALASIGAWSLVQGESPLSLAQMEVAAWVDQILRISQPQGASGSLAAEEIKKGLIAIFPSMIGIFGLIMVWANLLLLVRFNPVYLQTVLHRDLSFVTNWRAPEFLVWPTIVMGALVIFDLGWPSVMASNVFRFLMAIYGIQGLSILASLFDTWKIRGFFRTLGYILAVWPFTPLLLALGFFDLWFDFRARFRQS